MSLTAAIVSYTTKYNFLLKIKVNLKSKSMIISKLIPPKANAIGYYCRLAEDRLERRLWPIQSIEQNQLNFT